MAPGVTSGIAAPAYAGIPVTHRGLSSTLALATAHEDPDKPDSSVDWRGLARMGSVVLCMGARNLADVAEKLVGDGKPGGTPTAVIRWGTMARQEVCVGTLGRHRVARSRHAAASAHRRRRGRIAAGVALHRASPDVPCVNRAAAGA